MKKLFVLGLAIVMVLAFAAVSMAATVTTGGELDFGKNWCDKSNAGYENNVANAKVTFTAQIADDVKAFVAFKGDAGNSLSVYNNATPPVLVATGSNAWSVYVDEAWTQFTEDYGTIKVGYFGYGQNQKDIVGAVIGDVKSALTATYNVKLGDALGLNLAAANKGTYQGLDYSIGLAYDTDVFGGTVNYFKWATDDNSLYSVTAYYKIDALKLYAQYENHVNVNNASNFIVGGVYDSADVPLFVRAEYDLANQGYSSNDWALRLAYKVTGNYKFQYTMQHVNTDDHLNNELLLITTF